MAASELSQRVDALEQRLDLLRRDFYFGEARKSNMKELTDIVSNYGVQLPAVDTQTGVMAAGDVAAFIEAIAAKPTHRDDRNVGACERAAHLLQVCGWTVP